MKNVMVFLFALLTATFSVHAQPQNPANLDSLIQALSTDKEDTTKFKRLIDICQTYWSVDPPKGIQYAKQAIELSTKLNLNKGMATANGVLGMNYALISEYDMAEEYLQTSLKLSEKLKDWNGVAKCNGALGNVLYFQSKFPQAIDRLIASIKAAEIVQDTMSIAAGLSNVGAIYLDLESYPEALEYFNKAVELNEATHMQIYLAANIANIGAVYFKTKNWDKALEYHLKALEIAKQNNDIAALAADYLNIGSVYHKFREWNQAIDYTHLALKMSKQLRDDLTTAVCYTLIGQIYLSMVQSENKEVLNTYFSGNEKAYIESAKNHADSSIFLLKEIGNVEKLRDAYEVLSNAQSLLGDTKGALESFRLYAAAKDSVFNLEKDKKLTQTTMQYEFDKKEASSKAEQEKKDVKQRAIRNATIAGLIGALIFLLVVYRQRNKIAKEKERSEELLLNILPSEVAEELKSKGSADAKQFADVTVMFTDFKGFTQISEKLSPSELVAEIHTCFKAFDNIIGKHNIEKIKTIGDSYMCAGGVPVSNATHASDVVAAALEIQQFMLEHLEQRKREGKECFEIRIGVHTGPVVAGIVGVKKFAYDIWGDTVNIASRMESSGEVGKVNISGSTYALVKDAFLCQHRGKIMAKNKGEIDMYFVEDKRAL